MDNLYNNKINNMLYSTKSPYYRQFLSNAVNKKYLKNIEKAQGNVTVSDNRGNVNPSSVGVWFFISSHLLLIIPHPPSTLTLPHLPFSIPFVNAQQPAIFSSDLFEYYDYDFRHRPDIEDIYY